MLISPLAIFRSPETGQATHGCPHLATLKTPSSKATTPAFPVAAKEMMDCYRLAVRGTLGNSNRVQTLGSARTGSGGGSGGIKTAGSSSSATGIVKKDEESPVIGTAGAGKKRKRPTFLEAEILALEKVTSCFFISSYTGCSLERHTILPLLLVMYHWWSLGIGETLITPILKFWQRSFSQFGLLNCSSQRASATNATTSLLGSMYVFSVHT